MKTPKFKSKIFVGLSFIIWPLLFYFYVTHSMSEVVPLAFFAVFPMIFTGLTILLAVAAREYLIKTNASMKITE